MSRRRLLYSTLAVCLALAIVAPALAAKGGNGNGNGAKSGSSTTSSSTSTSTSTSSTSTSSPTTTTSGSSITLDGAATFGQNANFTATDPPTKWIPEMSVACNQGGTQVYLDVQTMSGSSPFHPQFMMWSIPWANAGGGSANCSADLFYYTWKGHTETGIVYLAHADFVANG